LMHLRRCTAPKEAHDLVARYEQELDQTEHS
jgi:hypothetical protein